MGKYPFAFSIVGYNFDEETYFSENGLGICKSFADAANILEKHYGSELISISHLELHEESTVITTSSEMRIEWEKAQNEGTCFETTLLDSEVRK